MTEDLEVVPPFLERLLLADGPSGRERPASEVWQSEAVFADVSVDRAGSAIARVGDSDPLVGIFGHIDEIGLIVTHIDEKGFLWFDEVGGWDAQVLVGHRVSVRTADGHVVGVIGRKPIHLLASDGETGKTLVSDDLCVDIGMATEAEAVERVRVGDTMVLIGDPIILGSSRIVGKALDNRVGAYIALEVIRRLADSGNAGGCSVAAVASTQEESSFSGARTAAFSLRPDVGIAVDGWMETDSPGADMRKLGKHQFGSGPIIERASTLSPQVCELLIETAEREGIPYTLAGIGNDRVTWGSITMTDADAIHEIADGIPSAVVSFPIRYLHTAIEMVDIRDIESTIALLTAFCQMFDSDAAARINWKQ